MECSAQVLGPMLQAPGPDKCEPLCRTLKQAESVLDVTDAMRELRNALSIQGSPFSHYGGSWDQLLQLCSSGGASLDELSQLLSELKSNARAWVKVREHEVPELGEDQKASQAKLPDDGSPIPGITPNSIKERRSE